MKSSGTARIYAGGQGIVLIIICFAVYTLAYLGRLNYSAAMTEMLAQGLITKQNAGLVNTAFFLVYGIGQLVFGMLGDRFSPFVFVGGGLFTSGVMNLIMYAELRGGAGVPVMIVVWAINGMAQSALWTPIIRILSTMLPEKVAIPACSNMMISCTVGTVGAYPLSTLLMKLSGWQLVFFVPGIVLIAASAVWAAVIAALRRSRDDFDPSRAASKPERRMIKPASGVETLKLLGQSGVLFLIPAVLLSGMIKEGASTWTPVMINEIFSVSPADSVLITTVIPLFSALGVFIARRLHERRHFNSMYSGGIFFAVAAICDVIMYFLGFGSIVVTLVSLGIISICALALNTVNVSIIPVHFARYGRSGTVCGLLNSILSLAFSLSSTLIGTVQPEIGWRGVIVMWACMSLAALGLQFALGRRWQRFAGADA